jgi:hypothetical protein
MIGNKESVLVVDKDKLFDGDTALFYGFRPAGGVDYRSVILASPDFQTHKHSPNVSNLKNIVVCCFIVNPDTGLLSIYRTDPDNKKHSKYSLLEHSQSNSPSISDYNLINFGSWSCSYSGHISHIDPSLKDPLLESRISDLEKGVLLTKTQDGEIVDGKILRSDLLGYIHPPVPKSKDPNLQSALVQEHFVLVYVLQTDASSVVKKDARSSQVIDLYSLREKIRVAELESARGKTHLSFDNWTKQSMHALAKYIHDISRKI